jgi:hypothetical protein
MTVVEQKTKWFEKNGAKEYEDSKDKVEPQTSIDVIVQLFEVPNGSRIGLLHYHYVNITND